MAQIFINKEKCTGCGSCMIACPFAAIEIRAKTAIVKDHCVCCMACLNCCESGAIATDREVLYGAEGDEQYRGVFVVCEHHDGKLREVTLELLGKGKELADKLNDKVSAILVGSGVGHLSQTLGAFGADEIYLVDNVALEDYETELYTTVLCGIIAKYKPAVVLYGATGTGRDLAPRVAARVKTGLTADCTALDIEESSRLLLQTRPAWGGNLMATIKCPRHRPQMATVRPRVMKKLPQDLSRQWKIERLDMKINRKSARTKLLELLKVKEQERDISEADVIIAAGRGIQKRENLKMIEELADELGASMAASRPLVDAGWLPHSTQVGQTGKTVCPRLYIAIGISGSLQHLVGMQDSERIIAINNDPAAPIFHVTDYGIVGDLFQVIPNLIAELRK
jgi:electron transfer flavoprotein alpha subunit